MVAVLEFRDLKIAIGFRRDALSFGTVTFGPYSGFHVEAWGHGRSPETMVLLPTSDMTDSVEHGKLN